MTLKTIKYVLLAGLISMPISAIFIHTKIHSQIPWLIYIGLFDLIIISLLFMSEKTKVYGFWLNAALAIAGIFFHLDYKAYSDVFLGIADISIGLALYLLPIEINEHVNKLLIKKKK
mgnify:CR=1 FL=1